MSLVERLRAYSEEGWPIVHEAAAEIELLTERLKRVTDQRVLLSAEVERLKAALQGCLDLMQGAWGALGDQPEAVRNARAALEGKA